MNPETKVVDIPQFLREQPISDLVVVDSCLPLRTLLLALAQAGLTVVNSRDGRLVITQRPEAFR